MKVKIKNLGAVHEADIELRPLTVFVGANNTGKTWAAYALSAVLGQYGWDKYTSAYVADKVSDQYLPIEKAIEQLLEEGNANIDLVQFFDEYGSDYINNVALLAPRWMREFMGTQQASFEDLRLDVELQDTRSYMLSGIRASSSEGKLSVSKEGKALLNAIKEPGESTLHFYTTESGVPEKFPRRVIKSFVAARVFMVIHRALYPDVYFFPAERAAITSFIRSVKVEPEIGHDDLPKKEPGGVPLAHPIGNLVTLTRDVYPYCSYAARLEEAKKYDGVRDILELAELPQKAILRGTLDLSKSEPELPGELLFELSGDSEVTLDMPVVSSMVKGLSSLVLYLRYIAKPRDLLVIDEPEMNLHPEAQVQLAEFLAMLVNAGLNVLVTTHSPYIVDHLVNLMKAATREDQESIKDKFYLGRTDAFISRDNVSVYLFEDNTAKNILDDEGFIDWDTFSRVSEQISHLYFEI